MEVKEIDTNILYVSDCNVRKTLEGEEDDTNISDLANDINTNGLINPITVRKMDDKYEIIAGQRRYLACKLLNKEFISCSIIDVSSQKAEELSLVENVQRNPMTNSDKVKIYSKLYEIYNKDINKVVNTVNISRTTIQKYLKINTLPEEVIRMLDSNTDNKINLDVAVELARLPDSVNKTDAIKNIKSLNSAQQKQALKQFVADECSDADDINEIKEEIVIQHNNINLAPSCPYVTDNSGRFIKIPKNLYPDVINLIINNSDNGLEYI
jgi:ParB family chromosome partitioning protein